MFLKLICHVPFYRKRYFKKTFLIVKLTAFLLLVACLQAGASGYAQKITLSQTNVSLKKIFKEIERQSEYHFFYKDRLLNQAENVSVNVSNASVEEVLDQCFKELPLTYTILDKTIVIKAKARKLYAVPAPALIELTNVPPNIISGSVKDAEGNPLAGVSVIVKGTNRGTSTGANGNFSIEANMGDVLEFTIVGYQKKSVNVGKQTEVNVTLELEVSDLSDVVVIGYGAIKKRDLTGAVSSVSMEDKNVSGSINIMQALVGASPGLNVEQRGGAGGSPNFSIRGQNSLSGSNSPLVVLDDAIFYGSLSDINPNDVEKVDILKGASAAAVYGRRASNGVLLITTKKGRSPKPVISLNVSGGIQDQTNNPMRVMNSEEFANRLVDFDWMERVLGWYRTNPQNDGGRPVRADITDRQIVASFLRTPEETKNYLEGNSIDWVNEVLQTAPIQNYNLSLAGRSSDQKLSYYLSGSFSDAKGILKNDRVKNVMINNKLNSKINDWLELGLNVNYSHRNNSGLPVSLGNARVASPLVDNHIGSLDYDILLGGELYQPYPLINQYVDNSDISTNLFAIGDLKIKIPWIKGLFYTLRYTHNASQRDNNTFYSSRTSTGQSNNGLATKIPTSETSWILDNIINYSQHFGDHSINATFLYSSEKVAGNSSTASATDFSTGVLGYNNLGMGTYPVAASSAYEEGSLSYMGRLNYSYRSKYMVTATMRRDGYSGFSIKNKWSNFPSIGIAWVPTEDFLKNQGFYLKTRLSYGLNGNQGIGRYASFSKMSGLDYVFGSQRAIGITPTLLGNEDLKWEVTKSFNLGFDFNFLKERISGSLDLYNSRTSDVLVQRGLPRVSGYNSVWTNLAQVANKGIEFTLNTVNLKKKDFEWNSEFNFSLNRDKIKTLYGDQDNDIGNGWFIGKPISAIYDYETLGVWKEEELFKGVVYKGWFPGQFKYADLNNDGAITPEADRKIIGYRSPSYRFSVGNSLRYRSFRLSIFINSVQGGGNRYIENNFEIINHPENMVFRKNISAINPYWLPDRQTNNTSALYVSPGPVVGGLYQSRSFVRIQDVTFAYSFHQRVLESLGLRSSEIYISSRNPYVWTNWQGWDPESGLSDTPVMRNFIFGVKVSF